MSPEERVKILEEAKRNSWIAFSSDESRVAGRGDTYDEAVEEAAKHGEEDPILVQIPDNWNARAFLVIAHTL